MKISKVVSAAGLAIAIGAFAPSVFAQAGAGGTSGAAPSGMSVPSGTGQNMGQAPSAGQPGTQAPASAAPVGSASSDYMANEGANGAQGSSMSGPAATNSETRARRLETKVQRDIVSARANGMNVARAEHHKWLGSMALSKGDRPGAIRHFELAERDLRTEGRNGAQYNNSRTDLNANETSQNPNAVNMHPNRGANSSY